MMMALGLSGASVGCSADDGSLEGEFGEASASIDDMSAAEASDESAPEAMELGTAEQAWWWSNFSFVNSCSDSKGTNSAMAALAVATATELKRWQPTKDFGVSNGYMQLTATGKARCADGKCWNTQAILDLQKAPTGTVELRPGVKLDSQAFRSELSGNLTRQLFSWVSNLVPEHRFELLYSAPGGCDQYYWFNVTSPTGGTVSSFLTSTLEKKLTWVGGDDNPYIQFESDGTTIGIDPTYGLNEAGATSSGSCAAACTKISSSNIAGQCCSCNGTKQFSRSPWNATTYLCQ